MFRIGEFSRLAQVSGRQLRHYDRLGLLIPEYTDPQSGYRYYTAQQLPRLNRILALKELGLSLEQIGRLLNEDIPTAEIRGMLLMKKAQMEQMLREEMARFRYIESRIEQIDNDGALQEDALVLKSVAPQTLVSTRHHCTSLPETFAFMQKMIHTLPGKIGRKNVEHLAALLHSEFYDIESLDLELGFYVREGFNAHVEMDDEYDVIVRELPAVDNMLTITRLGVPREGHGRYGAVAHWLEANRYQMAGKAREIFIQPPVIGKEHETVTEIQVPVEKIPMDGLYLSS